LRRYLACFFDACGGQNCRLIGRASRYFNRTSSKKSKRARIVRLSEPEHRLFADGRVLVVPRDID
jgi:hypothetical protein